MKSIVILSGGMDSTVSLHIATEKTEVVLTLTFDYGQKAARREISAAQAVSRHYGVPNRVIELPWLAEITTTALVNHSEAVPLLPPHELDTHLAVDSAKAVWVPNRNGVFINVAAAFAESMGADQIITGFNAEEAITFPDNSLMFIESAKKSLHYSTLNHVSVVSYTQALSKVGIVQLAREKKVPLHLAWSCYLGGEQPCGTCESCRRYQRAVNSADAHV